MRERSNKKIGKRTPFILPFENSITHSHTPMHPHSLTFKHTPVHMHPHSLTFKHTSIHTHSLPFCVFPRSCAASEQRGLFYFLSLSISDLDNLATAPPMFVHSRICSYDFLYGYLAILSCLALVSSLPHYACEEGKTLCTMVRTLPAR